MAETTPCQHIDVLGVAVVVKRGDMNHPVVQGNKLWKLKYNLQAAKQQGADTLITFGGAYSNHLLATAYAAKEAGFKSIGVVRGDELQNNQAVWSETLHQCQQFGMQLLFVNRRDYRLKQHSQAVQQLLSDLPKACLIPEGGSNQLALGGVVDMVSDMAQQLQQEPTHLICPVGTGGTLAGLIAGVSKMAWRCQLIGVSVLKGASSVKQDIDQWIGHLQPQPTWEFNQQYHGGGYAKSTAEMKRFALTFSQQHNIPLDKIYNIKSFYALAQMIKSGKVTNSDRPLILHTGGLQGGVL